MFRKPMMMIALSGVGAILLILVFAYWVGMQSGEAREQAAEAVRQAQATAEAREHANEVLESYQNIDDAASGIRVVDWLRDASKTFFFRPGDLP